MSYDWTTVFASIAAVLSALVSTVFGIDEAVAFAALAGAGFSLRFCEKKTVLGYLVHVALSTIAACYMVAVPLYFIEGFPALPIGAGLGLISLLLLDWVWNSTVEILGKVKEAIIRKIDQW